MLLFVRIAFAILGFLSRYLPSFIGAPEMSQSPGGASYGLRQNKSKRGDVVKSEVWLSVPAGLLFRLQDESAWTRFCKAIGLGREFHVGGIKASDFDRDFYIASDHAAFLTKLKMDSELQEIFFRLRKLGVEKFRSDGNSYLRMVTTLPVMHLSDDFKRDLDALSSKLKEIRETRFQVDPYFGKIMLLEAVLYSGFGYAIAAYLTFAVEPEIVHIDLGPLIFVGFIFGLVFLSVWLVAVFFLIRNSARAPLLLTDFLLIGFWIVVSSGPMLAADVNRALDTSQSEVILAGITDSYSRTTGTGKNRKTRFYLSLIYVSNPYRLPQEFEVGLSRSKFAVNQGIEFNVRQGYFGIPYIARMDSSPFPKGLITAPKAPVNDLSLKKSLVDNAMTESFRWRVQSQQKPVPDNAEVVEIKYRDGRLKSREHLVQGVKQGSSVYFHPNGQLYTAIDWRNGLRHGSFKLYRADGSLEQWSSYKDGKPHGMFAWFGSNGHPSGLTHLAIYKEGEVVDADLARLTPVYNFHMAPFFPGF